MENWHMTQRPDTGHYEIRDQDNNMVATAFQQENAQKIAAAPALIKTLQQVLTCAPPHYTPESIWGQVDSTLSQHNQKAPAARECDTIGCKETAQPDLVQIAPGTCIHVCTECSKTI